jgi:hypothetical protein
MSKAPMCDGHAKARWSTPKCDSLAMIRTPSCNGNAKVQRSLSYVSHIEKLHQSIMIEMLIWYITIAIALVLHAKFQWCGWIAFVTSYYYDFFRNVLQKYHRTYKGVISLRQKMSLTKLGGGGRRMDNIFRHERGRNKLRVEIYHCSLARWCGPSQLVCHAIGIWRKPSAFGVTITIWSSIVL